MAIFLYFRHDEVWVSTFNYHGYAIYEYYMISLHLRNNLGAGPLALTVAEIGDFSRSYGTYIGDLTVGVGTLYCSTNITVHEIAERNCDTIIKRSICLGAFLLLSF